MSQLTRNGLEVIEGRATYERIIASVRDVEADEALRQIQNFLKIYPDFAQAHNDLAVLFYQAGNGLKALAHYEKAHKLEPANITFRKNLADFYFVELEWADDAIHTYLDILKDNPFDIETLNALGTISVQIGRREQARQYFTRVLQLDEVNSQARQALQQLGGQLPPPPTPPLIASQPLPLQAAFVPPPVQQSPTAIPAPHEYQRVTMNPELLYRQAVELANSGKSMEAIRILEELVMHHPDHAVAHNDLGVLHQQNGDFAKARRHQEEALRLEPRNVNFQKNLADLLYIACGDTEEAMKLYVKVLGANPRDTEVLMAVGRICLESGKPDDARTFFNTILNIEPWNAEAREYLASAKKPLSAPQPPQEAPRSADEIHAEAVQLTQQDRLSEAHSLLEELVHHAPDYALGHNDLGVLRYRLGDVDGACRSYERAVELQPGNPSFRKNLADLYFTEMGRTDDAIHIYLDLFRLQPRDIETLAALGHICSAVGRPGEARSFYRRALEIEPWNSEVREALQKMV